MEENRRVRMTKRLLQDALLEIGELSVFSYGFNP